MLLFIIELFPILALAQSPFISVNSCNINQTFVINRDHGAVCNNDESYIKNSVQYMISRKKFYEFVPNNISESQEFVCKVNSTQYSDVLFVDTNMTKEPQSAIPIVCHVPDIAEDFYADVEVWNYKPSTNTADLMKIVDTTEPNATEWNEYIDHVQFSRSENIAGLKGDYGSTVLRWDDAPYNPCGNCSVTTNGLIFNNTFKSENYCLLRENYCVYSDSVNCTSSFGGACFDSSALTAPAPPPRLPSPPFPPSPPLDPPTVTFATYTRTFNQGVNSFALEVNSTVQLSEYGTTIPYGTQIYSFGESVRTKIGTNMSGTFEPGIGYLVESPQTFNLIFFGAPFSDSYSQTFITGTQSFGLRVNRTVHLSTYGSMIPYGTQIYSFGQSVRTKIGANMPGTFEPGREYLVETTQIFTLNF